MSEKECFASDTFFLYYYIWFESHLVVHRIYLPSMKSMEFEKTTFGYEKVQTPAKNIVVFSW